MTNKLSELCAKEICAALDDIGWSLDADWLAAIVERNVEKPLRARAKKIERVLKEHHDWHLGQTGPERIEGPIGSEPLTGGIEIVMADEYADSGMCDRTEDAFEELER